jgi:hypothetical protein
MRRLLKLLEGYKEYMALWMVLLRGIEDLVVS